ncbi:phenol 2-monooxygenase (NADPH), partial [Phenoliferia sp. Uapishka_3]
MTPTNGNLNGHANGPTNGTDESNVDVLIIGAGPAGVMAADVLARFTERGLTVRIVDKRSGNLDNGQADGLNCRSLEIFEALGFVESIEKEGSRMSEINFWNPDAKTGRLVRTGKIPDTIPGLSRFQQTILHQTRIEAHLTEDAAKYSKGAVKVERGIVPESLTIDESLVDQPDAYPITVTLRHLSEAESNPNGLTSTGGVKSGLFRSSLVSAAEEEALYQKQAEAQRVETVKAKYVIGCDGAHSWTRRTLGIKMIGEQTNFVWGVMDAVPLTNFPDIRSRCAIHSANSGSIMIIPQERDLVRLYIQLPVQVKPGEYLDRSKVTPESILDTARSIMAPYTIDTAQIEWFTGYHIGQRLTESFARDNRVFLAGDACHTHSPKAGQGMNTSMQDTYNLAWKVGYVLLGLAKPELLLTYSAERQVVAKTLIDFDTKFSKLFSGKPATSEDTEDGVSLTEFKDVFATGNRFAAGMSIDYADSILVGRGGTVQSKQHLAANLPVGQRFFSAQVVNVASATPDQLTTRMPMTGAFHLLVFAGNVAEKSAMDRLKVFANYLDGPESVVSKYTPEDQSRSSVIDVITIHSSPRIDVELYDFPQPSIFPPHNYKKIYADEPSYHRGDGKAYETYGISKEVGAVVIVRPDQYTSLIVGLEDTELLDQYFAQFLLPAKAGFPASKVATVSPPDWSKVKDQVVSHGRAVPDVQVALDQVTEFECPSLPIITMTPSPSINSSSSSTLHISTPPSTEKGDGDVKNEINDHPTMPVVELKSRSMSPADLPWSYKAPALLMVLSLNCASYWFSQSIAPLKTILIEELSLNNSQYSVISASGNLVNSVVPVITGVAIDYYGAEWLSLGASSFILLGSIIAGVGASTKSYGTLVAGEVIVGLGSITIETAQLKIYRMHMCSAASILFIVVFALVGFTQVNSTAISIIQGVALAINFIPFTLAVPIVVPNLQYMGTAQGTYSAFINAAHVVVITASGAIQDNSPKGAHAYARFEPPHTFPLLDTNLNPAARYNRVLYFFMAIKVLDVCLGVFYIVLDRLALNSILTRSEGAQNKRNILVAGGDLVERRAPLLSPSRVWTLSGLVTGACLVVSAWTKESRALPVHHPQHGPPSSDATMIPPSTPPRPRFVPRDPISDTSPSSNRRAIIPSTPPPTSAFDLRGSFARDAAFGSPEKQDVALRLTPPRIRHAVGELRFRFLKAKPSLKGNSRTGSKIGKEEILQTLSKPELYERSQLTDSTPSNAIPIHLFNIRFHDPATNATNQRSSNSQPQPPPPHSPSSPPPPPAQQLSGSSFPTNSRKVRRPALRASRSRRWGS